MSPWRPPPGLAPGPAWAGKEPEPVPMPMPSMPTTPYITALVYLLVLLLALRMVAAVLRTRGRALCRCRRSSEVAEEKPLRGGPPRRSVGARRHLGSTWSQDWEPNPDKPLLLR